ncbi:MAG: hypothetical protein ACUVUD_04245 [bacterium]
MTAKTADGRDGTFAPSDHQQTAVKVNPTRLTEVVRVMKVDAGGASYGYS